MRYSAVIRSDDEPAAQTSDLPAIPGDTYAVKAELKLLGAVWDKAERIWRIAPDKLAQARALVENQTLIPKEATGENGTDLETLADPFEADSNGPRYALLSEQDGNLYAAKDALKAIGAKWDKNDRAWKVREERAEYARAIVASVTDEAGESPRKRAVAPRPKPAAPNETAAVPVAAKRDAPMPQEKPAPAKTQVETDVPSRVETTPESAAPKQQEAITNSVTPAFPIPQIAGGMPLGGLWRRRGPDGKVFLVGYLSDTVEIHIVGNEQKQDENDPSHLMVLFSVPPAE